MSLKRKVTVLAEYDGSGSVPLGVDPTVGAVQMGDLVYTSGIIGVDPATGALGDGPERQFDLAYQNLKALMDKAGAGADSIGLVNVFIPGSDYRQYINKGWLVLFPDENNRPARKTNHVKLPDGVFVQLQAVAVTGQKRQRVEIPGLAHRDPLPMGCRLGNMVFSSVIAPQDPADGSNVKGPIEQIQRCFDNTKIFMKQAGGSLDDVIHMWAFMSDFTYQPDMVDIWVNTWPQEGDRPARKTLRYALGGDSLIQVQVTGVIGGKRANFEIPDVGHHDPIPMSARIGNVLYSSGISGVPPFTGDTTAVRGLAPQIAICQWGAETVIEQAGGSLDDLALLTVLISDFNSIPTVQKHFNRLFPDKTNRPVLKFIDWRMPQGHSHVQYHVTSVFS